MYVCYYYAYYGQFPAIICLTFAHAYMYVYTNTVANHNVYTIDNPHVGFAVQRRRASRRGRTTSQGNCHVLGERMTTFVRLHGLTEGDVTNNGSYAMTTDFLAVCVRTSFKIDQVIDSSFDWWQTRSVKYL